VHFLELQRLLVEQWTLADALELPRSDVGILFVVAQCLAIRCLAFLPEVAAA
jgi:hypothetical protein